MLGDAAPRTAKERSKIKHPKAIRTAGAGISAPPARVECRDGRSKDRFYQWTGAVSLIRDRFNVRNVPRPSHG